MLASGLAGPARHSDLGTQTWSLGPCLSDLFGSLLNCHNPGHPAWLMGPHFHISATIPPGTVGLRGGPLGCAGPIPF